MIRFEPHGFIVFLTLAMGLVYAVFNSRSGWGFWKIAIVGIVVIPFLYYGLVIGRVVEIVAGSLVGLLVATKGAQSPAWYDHLRLFISNPRLYFRLMDALKRDDEPDHTKNHKPDDAGSGWNSAAEEEAYRRQQQAKARREQASADGFENPDNQSRESSQGEPPEKLDKKADTRTPHEIMGLQPGASLAEIKKAYSLLRNRYHPDKYAHMSEEFQKEAAEEFKNIQQAWERLNARK